MELVTQETTNKSLTVTRGWVCLVTVFGMTLTKPSDSEEKKRSCFVFFFYFGQSYQLWIKKISKDWSNRKISSSLDMGPLP